MAETRDPFGLSCALATPFTANGDVDVGLLVSHSRARLDQGCASVTVFGTTGEGPSIGADERRRVLEGFAQAGFEFRREVVVCCATSAAGDVAAQMSAALAFGCRAILLPPPFYFKGLGEDGLFDWFSTVFAAVGAELRDVLLYHIPSVTAVPLPLPLIARLKRSFPGVVRGVKDSGGAWEYSGALLAQNPDLTILIGDERHLGQAMPLGAEGSISGTANFCPDILLAMMSAGREDKRVTRLVEEILRFPVTPAVKALIAHRTGNRDWLRVSPPLRPLTDSEARGLAARTDAVMGW